MRNFKKICITIILSLGFLSSTVLATTGIVNAPSGLVLRSEKSKVSDPITTVPDKTEVNIIEESEEWYKVEYNNQTGYLFKSFVDTNQPAEPNEPDIPENNKQQTDNVTAKGKLKVYVIPVMSSTVINEIDSNTEIKVEKEITNWSYITAGNVQGWVRTYGIKNDVKTSTDIQEPTQKEEPTIPEKEETETTTTPTVTEPEETIDNEPADNSGSKETAVDNIKGFVTVDFANVRKEASTSSAIVTTLTKDTSFTITAETDEWYKITYTGIDDTVYNGYIYKNLTTK